VFQGLGSAAQTVSNKKMQRGRQFASNPSLCCKHNPFPLSILQSNMPHLQAEKAGTSKWDMVGSIVKEEEIYGSPAKLLAIPSSACPQPVYSDLFGTGGCVMQNQCHPFMTALVFRGYNNEKWRRVVCLPFPPVNLTCKIEERQSSDKSEPKMNKIRLVVEHTTEFPQSPLDPSCPAALQSVSFTCRELNVYYRILESVKTVTIVPSEVSVNNEHDDGYGSDTVSKQELIANGDCKPSELSGRKDCIGRKCMSGKSACHHAYAADSLHSFAYQREFPIFINICGYMMMRYKPNPVYLNSKYMHLYSNDARLGRGDMVNGGCGKFCVENNPAKISRHELQKITFTAVKEMGRALQLVSQMTVPNSPAADTCAYAYEDAMDVDLLDGQDSVDSRVQPSVVVHMVIMYCRISHHVSFSGVIDLLPLSIRKYKLEHIFAIERRLEMDTSMVFLKVVNCQALLEWAESAEGLDYKLCAYKQACNMAHSNTANALIDIHCHVMARITRNGFIQMHLMWNKHRHDNSQEEGGFVVQGKGDSTGKGHTDKVQTGKGHTDKGHTDKVQTGKGHTDKVHTGKVHHKKKATANKCSEHMHLKGIQWTTHVEKMAKMRVGLVMAVIEMLC
jgi:hypothetical protein